MSSVRIVADQFLPVATNVDPLPAGSRLTYFSLLQQMHHVHTEDSLLSQKITAIINCFIDSQIPPSLQLDLPQEMADRILDRKYEKSPYLFREAQVGVPADARAEMTGQR